MHPETTYCKNLEDAKVLVDVDLTKSLPKSFTFDSGKGGNITVENSFPRLAPGCGECSKWRLATGCARAKQITTAPVQEREENIRARTSSPGVSVVDIITEETKNVAAPMIPTTKIMEKAGEENDVDLKTTGNSEGGWSTPTRFIRSPRKSIVSQYENISLLQEKKFDCLQEKGEDGEILEILEPVINEESLET